MFLTMKLAHLTEEEKQALNQFEAQLGVVLVAYENEKKEPDVRQAFRQPENQSPSM